jgi:hydroxypyruvate reductase
VHAVDPAQAIARALTRANVEAALSASRSYAVVAAGKAAWPMACAFAAARPEGLVDGLIAGPRVGEWQLPDRFSALNPGHPLPTVESVAAGERALAIARQAGDAGATLVVLLSGGASAMLVAPAPEIALDDKIATARLVMRAGEPIDRLNCVRKHLSALKGGGLALAAGRTMTLAISDVHGPVADDPAVIGSGPTVADPTTYAEALEIAERVGGLPAGVMERLRRGARGEVPETAKPGDPRVTGHFYEVIANRRTALDGARQAAEARGYRVFEIPEPVTGEARDASRAFVAQAAAMTSAAGGRCCVIAAGETTVTVRGHGLGGRNQEFALAAAPVVAALPGIAVLASLGTDGIDGPTPAGGAMVDSATIARALASGLGWESTLAANDAYHFFAPLGDLIAWGPTGTNVGDVQMLLTVDRV